MNLGADDFITKPYDLQILLARLQSLLRRTDEISETLTKNELRILTYLMNHPNTIVSRHDLMQYLWNTDWLVDDNTLTVNINRLRKKLDRSGVADFIETKWGMGYIIHEIS